MRILLFSSNPGPAQAKDITDFLVMNRLKYKLAYSGRNLPDLISLNKGIAKYLVIVFQDIRDFYHMEQWNKEVLEKYCRQFKVGILGFLPSGEEEVENAAIDETASNGSSPFRVSSHQSIRNPSTGQHPLLRIIKSNLSISGTQPGNHWVRFDSPGSGVDSVMTALFSDGKEAPIVIEDRGETDNIKKVVIGGSNAMQHWFMKLLFLDSLQYLSSGEIVLHVDLEAFIEEFGNLKERYVGMKKHIEKLENLLETIEKMNSERLDNFICIRNIITNNVRRRFNLMIKEFSKQIGSEVFLRIDNTNKELTFSFKNSTGSRSSSDVSVLSGGEKSFTQMCLICALWDMMRPPFRCLDEWDVFLDAVNRKAISEELLNFSLRNQDRQFIFISPQGACDLSKVNHGSVSITEIKKS